MRGRCSRRQFLRGALMIAGTAVGSRALRAPRGNGATIVAASPSSSITVSPSGEFFMQLESAQL